MINKKLRIETMLSHLGRKTGGYFGSVNPPLVRSSTILFHSLSDFRDSYKKTVFENPRYGRSGTATSFELQQTMAEIEGTESCLAASSGLSAIVMVLSAYSFPGKHILISRGVYAPVKRFCDEELTLHGCDVEYFDPDDEISSFIRENTTLVYIEVPASLTMEMFDIEKICRQAHEKGIPVACDSTWGTPVFFKPHNLGIDISIHAATKYICGHSDTMLGLITGSYEHLAPVRTICDRYGSHAAPDSCWLALRGLRTLSVRMMRHQESTRFVTQWIRQQAEIKRMYFPAMGSKREQALLNRQFSGCAGPFTVELIPCSEKKFEAFFNALELFGLGTSWGGFESLVMPAIPHQLRAAKKLPDAGRLVRFHIGLEDPDDLCQDIRNGLNCLVKDNFRRKKLQNKIRI